LYVSGSASVGWWAMFITMLGDITAFVCLVFGYFYYWTIHKDFPPAAAPGPAGFYSLLGAALILGAWGLTILARRENRRDRGVGFYIALGAACLLASAGSVALIAAPWRLSPSSHVYPAIVWLLVIWSVVHVGVGLIMQLYCIARRLAGRMSARHDIDITNVTLYWHFTAITVAITVAVIAGFPRVA
jgi:cytochrome c oxidase subunit I+III